MYDLLAPKELKTDQDLYGEPSDQLFIQTIIIVPNDQLVKIVAE